MPYASPNTLVHPLKQRLLFQFGAAFALVLVQKRVVHHRNFATGALPACSQGNPRWALFGLFVPRLVWHNSDRCLFDNLHVALRVSFSIGLDFFRRVN